jgi:predicted PurR-regulated permease PerM
LTLDTCRGVAPKERRRMIENIEAILKVVTFIALGGVAAIIFFFIYAQVITGSKTIHKQLERLIELNEEIVKLLKQLNSKSKD